MTKAGDFLVFCAEIYRLDKQMTGKDVVDLFSKFNVWKYIYDYYEALHVTGNKYIISDIDEFIAVRS